MPEGGKSAVSTVICGLVIGAGLNFFLWSKFKQDLDFYREQRPALCVDGRRMGEDLMEARVGTDDTKRNKGMITMQCSWPVAVYPCYDDDIELGEWTGQCRTLSSTPAYLGADWPRRMDEDIDIKCCERGCLGGDQCSDVAWSCATGACNAYDKAIRICAARTRNEPYKCFTNSEDPTAGMREDNASFPVGFLIGGMISGLLFCGCCCFAGMSMREAENCIMDGLMYCGACSICIGLVFALNLIIRAVQGEPDKRGIVEADYKDLAQATGVNQTAVAAEAPPPEGMHWAIILLIIFGSMLGVCCLGLGCMFGFHCCKELGWKGRAKAASSVKPQARVISGSGNSLSVGDSVSLSAYYERHDTSACNGCLKLGDVGMVDDFVTGDRPVQVKFDGRCHCYMDVCLVAVDDGLKTGASNFSIASGKSNREVAKMKSREDLNNLIKTTSGISVGEKIGHAVLSQAEDARALAKAFNPMVSKKRVPGYRPNADSQQVVIVERE